MWRAAHLLVAGVGVLLIRSGLRGRAAARRDDTHGRDER